MHSPRRPTTLVCVGILIGLTACSAPIGVKRVGMRPVYRSLRANALSTDRPSEWTRNTVNSWGLLRRFDDDPEGALGALREIVTSGRGASTELFALGELSFLHAEDTGKKPYYFAATVYMYAFLFPGERHDRPDELDPRTRLAVDFYNHAIARAFTIPTSACRCSSAPARESQLSKTYGGRSGAGSPLTRSMTKNGSPSTDGSVSTQRTSGTGAVDFFASNRITRACRSNSYRGNNGNASGGGGSRRTNSSCRGRPA